MFGIDDIIGGLMPVVNTVIDRVIPDPAAAAAAKLAAAKMQQDGELAQLTAVTNLAKGQLAVDQAEAAGKSEYAADWRPTIGYIMGAIMGWVYVGAPFLTWFTALIGHPTPMPVLDFNSVSPVLMGMLGLAGMHTYENVQSPK